MPRQVLLTRADGPQVLRESLAHDEAQLQLLLRDNPALVPLDDLGLVGPPMVVGKETTVPSGAIDLVLVARGGELVLVEFKTGPQNPDFRAALAQLLDYGSDLWQMTLEEFERTVAVRFFSSKQAAGTPYQGCRSLSEAMARTWADNPLSDEETASFTERLSADLADGSFTYIVAAQRFTEPMRRTAGYLNAVHRGSTFTLVEMVRFTDGTGEEVFEARTVLRPQAATGRPSNSSRLDREQLMERLGEAPYPDVVGRLLDEAEAVGLLIEWGKTGISIRLPNTTGTAPVSVAWFNPPGVSGWLGLTDLVLGFDPAAAGYPAAKERVDAYFDVVSGLGGAPVTNGGLQARKFSPAAVTEHVDGIVAALGTLAAPGDL